LFSETSSDIRRVRRRILLKLPPYLLSPLKVHEATKLCKNSKLEDLLLINEEKFLNFFFMSKLVCDPKKDPEIKQREKREREREQSLSRLQIIQIRVRILKDKRRR